MVIQGYRDHHRDLRRASRDFRHQKPQPLSAAYDHPDKEAAIHAHLTRFREDED